MPEFTLTGSGFIDQVSFNPLRLKVTVFGRADALDQVEPKRWMEVGWIAGFESFTDGNTLEQARYVGPLHWIMFEHQTVLLPPEFDGGGYDGVAYSIRPESEVVIFF